MRDQNSSVTVVSLPWLGKEQSAGSSLSFDSALGKTVFVSLLFLVEELACQTCCVTFSLKQPVSPFLPRCRAWAKPGPLRGFRKQS